MSPAEDIIDAFNPNALKVEQEDGTFVFIEDVADLDGRLFRIEYESTWGGEGATAFCRHNPWGGVNGGQEFDVGHVANDGLLCLGDVHDIDHPEESPYSLDYVIRRARYWAIGFSILMETGRFPQP